MGKGEEEKPTETTLLQGAHEGVHRPREECLTCSMAPASTKTAMSGEEEPGAEWEAEPLCTLIAQMEGEKGGQGAGGKKAHAWSHFFLGRSRWWTPMGNSVM